MITAQILEGALDSQLDAIISCCNQRKKYLSTSQGQMLRPGDRVRITSGRPRYLIGTEATVLEVLHTWIKIRLDQDIGKFSATATIRCPMSIITPIK